MNWLICFLLAPIAIAQQPASEDNQLALLEGTVVNAATKEPVRKAHVNLELSDQAHDSVLIATTDEAGRFRFADIKPGRYKLTAQKSGFLDGVYGGLEPDDDGSLLKVGSGDRLPDLTLRLFPGGTIAGRVLDADGDPVSNNEVILWTPASTHGNRRASHRADTTTDQSGEYRFVGLSSGTYYVSASAGAWGYSARQVPVDASGKVTKVHDLTTFYPAALSLTDAQAVIIESGQEQPGIDIRIQRGATLSVKGRVAGISGSPSKYSLRASVDDGRGWTSEAGKFLPNGDFEFAELPPGKHTLMLLDRGPNGSEVIGKTEVNLAEQDLTGVVITAFRPGQVRVRVAIEGEEDKPLTAGSVFLNPAADGTSAMNSLSQYRPQNGTYVIDGVPPGKYRVWFNNATDCYLKSVQSGERVVNPESIDVGDGAVVSLLMIFSKNGASLSGDIEVLQDQPKTSISVLLISEDASPKLPAELGGIVSPSLDQTLHFSSAHLRPGKYLAFAAQESDWNLWKNPDFVKPLQAEGVEVELHEKEGATLHLKLITKDETDRVRKRLGI